METPVPHPSLDPAPLSRKSPRRRMLSVHNLRVEYGARVLFSDLTFSILPKERIAFAGHNGAGKSRRTSVHNAIR